MLAFYTVTEAHVTCGQDRLCKHGAWDEASMKHRCDIHELIVMKMKVKMKMKNTVLYFIISWAVTSLSVGTPIPFRKHPIRNCVVAWCRDCFCFCFLFIFSSPLFKTRNVFREIQYLSQTQISRSSFTKVRYGNRSCSTVNLYSANATTRSNKGSKHLKEQLMI